MSKPQSQNEVLCSCVGLTHGEARRVLARVEGQDFEKFLEESRAGRDCTACMLDLEHFFVNAPRTKSTETVAIDAPIPAERLSLKQRLYRVLDRLSPMVPLNSTNVMPVLLGPGIEQYLLVSNFGLLYEETDDLSDFRVHYVLRDRNGKECFRDKATVPVGEMLRVKLTDRLPRSGNFEIGSVAVDTYAARPGVRGTTRPQTEILTEHAAASLHFQAAQPMNNRTFTTAYRPADERTCFSLVNGSRHRATATAVFRSGRSGETLAERNIDLEPFATDLIELSFTDKAPVTEGEPVVVSFTGKGFVRLHVICADRDLTRISIDHI